MTTVLFAVQNETEQALFSRVVEDQALEMRLILPDSVHDADRLVSSGTTDIIVTDFQFQNGGFADWLFLWQHPFVILAEWSDYNRLHAITADQTSDFVIRDGEFRHIHYLPLVIRKVLNNKESMERHNIDLRMNERRYRELVQALPDIVYTLDGEGRITFVNDSAAALGWDPVELIGKHFSVLLDEKDVARVSRLHVLPALSGVATGNEEAPKLFDERRRGDRRTRDLEVQLKHKASYVPPKARYGTVIAYGEVSAVGYAENGDLEHPGTVGIIRDITHRVETDRLLQRNLREKEILLAEIHHRVKNNMQVISSLLSLHAGSLHTGSLHAGSIENEQALQRFLDAETQIQSMALIHEHLYQSEHFDAVEIDNYVQRLVEHLLEVYHVDPDRIHVEYDLEPLTVTVRQAVPMALLLNELLSNSFKYAFPNDARGSILISARLREESTVQLTVRDSGIGLREDFDIRAQETLGYTLITGLVDQLEGELVVDGTGGTCYSIRFPYDPGDL